MIRVLQVIGSLHYAGIESVIMSYYRNIDRSQVRFDFVTCSRGGRFEEEIRLLGGKIFYLPGKSRHPLRYMKELAKVIRENHYDVVHSNTNSASAYLDLKAAKQAGCKVRIAHSHNSSCLVKWQHRIFKPLLPSVITHRFACSEPAAKWLFGKNKDYKIVHNGIDYDRFRFDKTVREEVRKRFSWSGSFVIGNVASFQERKNQRFLIELMPDLLKRIPGARLALVGKGETEPLLKERAAALGLTDRVEFLGNRDDVCELMQAFDVFCFPSKFDGLGIAYIEAAACNLPVIISDGVPFVAITDAICRLPLDPEGWLSAIERAATLDRDKVAKAEDAPRYDIRQKAKELERDYLSMVSEAGIAAGAQTR